MSCACMHWIILPIQAIAQLRVVVHEHSASALFPLSSSFSVGGGIGAGRIVAKLRGSDKEQDKCVEAVCVPVVASQHA